MNKQFLTVKHLGTVFVEKALTRFMRKQIITIIALLFFGFSSQAQMSFDQWEDSLLTMLKKARNEQSIPKMEALNQEFSQVLEKVILKEGAFDYEFPKMSQTMSTITSPDRLFRFFNWNIEDSYKEHNFYALVLKYNPKEGNYSVIELKDNYRYIFNPDTKNLDHRNWYGALYYEIIPVKKGNKTVYTLLGWNGNNRASTKKIVEAMSFSKDRIKFGETIFKYGKEMKRRIVFEYSAEANMSLKYHKRKKKEQKIIFNHLSPQSPQVEGIYSFYFPDESFDALILEGNKWVLTEKIEVGIKTPKGFNQPE